MICECFGGMHLHLQISHEIDLENTIRPGIFDHVVTNKLVIVICSHINSRDAS